MAPYLGPDQVIAQVFNGNSNLDTRTPRLLTQTRFITPLSCDLKPEISKPTSSKIVVSDYLAPDM